jgi:GT2 family glycosyltransferase/2-polyprenyl-3-methyl-5-hydroxy-6-metoxy-1,4-benzoquinol methylase
MKYSIIIGTLNHLEDCLIPCCEAIKKYTDLSNVEVIIVANGCTDGTREYVESLGESFKLLWFDKPLGYARANNEGLKVASGEYIVLLNNDAFLLEQPVNQWLDMLEKPFKKDPTVGLTGPIKGRSDPAGRDFIIFFCVMIKREVFDKLGLLDESFGVGGGEDTAFSIEAEKIGYKLVQVPDSPTEYNPDTKLIHGGFKIYHKGEATVHDKSLVPEWGKIFEENSLKLAKRYNPSWYKWKISNNSERAVFGKNDSVDNHPREVARYTHAANNLSGKKVLEIGCSSGYALKFLPKDVDYTGLDYDSNIIEYARDNFGREGVRFICADIHTFEFVEHYDTIIAYEFIEHISDGKEMAQKLKQHCNKLFLTVPYMEPRSAPWGPHHKMHELAAKDFPNFDYKYVLENGQIAKEPQRADGLNLLLMTWEKGKTYAPPPAAKPKVLCSIPTKDRYDILSSCLISVAMQTRKPDHIMIFDDGEQKDLRNDPIYKHIFSLFANRGIPWSVVFTPKKGQQYAHNMANNSDYDFVWRIDDDEIAEPDVLEKLLGHMTEGVGAVGGAVYVPGNPLPGGTGKLSHIFTTPNLQWAPGDKVYEVDHLYSSFLYRTKIAQYNLDLSPVAHREETLFSHELKERGYRLIVDTSIKTYHFQQEKGGIRSHDNKFFYEADNRLFIQKMEEWGYKIINLNSGLGDHLVFLHILPDLMKKHKHLMIGCCYPDVFDEYKDKVTLLPVAATEQYGAQNIYKWMIDHNWNAPLLEAYKGMYGV